MAGNTRVAPRAAHAAVVATTRTYICMGSEMSPADVDTLPLFRGK